MTLCSEKGCDAAVRARGLCQRHYNAAHYAAHREETKAQTRRWTKANADKVAERNRARDRAEMAAAARDWYQRNRLRAIAATANRKARRLGVKGTLTADSIAARFAFFAGRCWVCREPGADSVDHVKPLAVGGANLAANIRPAHLGCNAARSWEGRR